RPRASAGRRYRTVLGVEALESRLAPAATFVNATTATFTDVDGDLATIRITQPLFTAANVNSVLLFDASGTQLRQVDLTNLNPAQTGLGVSVTARPTAGVGDGFVNVGQIIGGGLDLGNVLVRGDLGRIIAGDAFTATPGLRSLTVQSLGRFGTT